MFEAKSDINLPIVGIGGMDKELQLDNQINVATTLMRITSISFTVFSSDSILTSFSAMAVWK